MTPEHSDRFDLPVVGNGVIGLAIALACHDREPDLRIAVVGPGTRPGEAPAPAAAAMLAFAEARPAIPRRSRDFAAKFEFVAGSRPVVAVVARVDRRPRTVRPIRRCRDPPGTRGRPPRTRVRCPIERDSAAADRCVRRGPNRSRSATSGPATDGPTAPPHRRRGSRRSGRGAPTARRRRSPASIGSSTTRSPAIEDSAHTSQSGRSSTTDRIVLANGARPRPAARVASRSSRRGSPRAASGPASACGRLRSRPRSRFAGGRRTPNRDDGHGVYFVPHGPGRLRRRDLRRGRRTSWIEPTAEEPCDRMLDAAMDDFSIRTRDGRMPNGDRLTARSGGRHADARPTRPRGLDRHRHRSTRSRIGPLDRRGGSPTRSTTGVEDRSARCRPCRVDRWRLRRERRA